MPGGRRVAGQVEDDQPPVGFGDTRILAVEFSNPIVAYSLLADGQTSQSSSRHSSGHIRLFAEHDHKRVWFSEPEIRANRETEYHP